MKALSKHIKELDKVFSQFIRLRDSKDGICKCITCGKYAPIKEMHCGHFFSRRYFTLRWTEENCAAQCPGCNLFNQGDAPKFGLELQKRYGKDIVEQLELKKHNYWKAGKFELEILIKEYKNKVTNFQD